MEQDKLQERLDNLLGIYRDRWNWLYHMSTYSYNDMLQQMSQDYYLLDKYLGTDESRYNPFADDLFDFIKAFNGYVQENGRVSALYFLNNLDENRNGKHLSQEMERVYALLKEKQYWQDEHNSKSALMIFCEIICNPL